MKICTKCGLPRPVYPPKKYQHTMKIIERRLKRGRLQGVERVIKFMLKDIQKMREPTYESPLLLNPDLTRAEYWELFDAYAEYQSRLWNKE